MLYCITFIKIITAITCSALSLIEKGVIVYSSNTAEPYDYGTTAVYECDIGYEVTSGDSERTCTESALTLEGIWNGTISTCSGIVVWALCIAWIPYIAGNFRSWKIFNEIPS